MEVYHRAHNKIYPVDALLGKDIGLIRVVMHNPDGQIITAKSTEVTMLTPSNQQALRNKVKKAPQVETVEIEDDVEDEVPGRGK